MTKLPPNINFLENKDLNLEILLDNICEQLQLDRTREKQMQKAYDTVSGIIENDETFFGKLDPIIYVYGSKAIGTTTKPYGKEEFDLDFIVQVNYDWNKISIDNFLSKLFNLLNSNGNYKGKVELKRFCVRINYAGDFHMDIMPGCEIPLKKEKLKVADTKLKLWAIRNPKGYTRWFIAKFIVDSGSIKLNDYYKHFHDLKLKSEVEEMPENPEYNAVQPLQRSVQLMKRYRDVYFESNSDLATSSIIITTIAGMFYNNETSIVETIDGILERLVNMINLYGMDRPIEIINPADANENENERERFSDKWKEGEKGRRRYKAFVEFSIHFAQNWELLRTTTTKPHELLAKMFGSEVTEKSFENQIRIAGSWRNDNSLFVKTSGIMTISNKATKQIPKTTIHGITT